MKRPGPFSTCHRSSASITPCTQTNTPRDVMETSGNKHAAVHTSDQWQRIKHYHSCRSPLPFFSLSPPLPSSLSPSGHVLWVLPNYTTQNSSYRAGTFICLFCISLPRSCMQNPSVIDLFILWLCLAEIKQWADWRGTACDWWSILRLTRTESWDEVLKCASRGMSALTASCGIQSGACKKKKLLI